LNFCCLLPISDGQQEAVMNRNKDTHPEGLSKQELERELEEGLEGTFPASDPPTATQPVHHEQRKKH
jgi:hypothetical protein